MKIFRNLLLAVQLFSGAEAATWMPTDSPSLGDSSNFPTLSMDNSGNTIAIWLNETSNEVSSSYLPAGSTTWGTLRTVSAAPGLLVSTIDMNGTGTAVGAWDEGADVAAAIYDSTTATWADYTTLPLSHGPAVAINDSGVAMAVSLLTTGLNLEYRIYDSGSWSAVGNISPVNLDMVSDVAIGMDANGFVVAVWDGAIGGVRGIQAATYNPGTMSWGAVELISPAGERCEIPEIAIDPTTGNAIAAWSNGDTLTAQVAHYTAASQTWSTPFDVPDADSGFPSVGVDEQGNGIVSWFQGLMSPVLRAARLPAGSMSWGEVSTISDPANPLEVFFGFGVGLQGDAAAVWNDGVGLKGAVLSAGSNSWSSETLLAASNYIEPSVVVGNQGNVVAAWRPFAAGPQGGAITQILSSASLLTGKQKINRFLAQSERYNQLNWAPDYLDGIVAFHIYRNGILIAQVGPNVTEYQDHHRIKGVADTYTVISVGANGEEGSPESVTIP